MLDETNRIMIQDESGQEIEMEIILTFEYPETHKNFVLVQDPKDPSGDVYAFAYDEDGNLDAVTDPEEFEICAQVLNAFQEEDEE